MNNKSTEGLLIKNKNSTAQLLENGIAYLFLHPNTCLEIEDYKAALDSYDKFSNGKRLKMLIEFGEYTTSSTEGREYAQKNNPNGLAEAIVIKSLAQRILSRMYTMSHHSDHPIKIFKHKEKAIEWLESVE